MNTKKVKKVPATSEAPFNVDSVSLVGTSVEQCETLARRALARAAWLRDHRPTVQEALAAGIEEDVQTVRGNRVVSYRGSTTMWKNKCTWRVVGYAAVVDHEGVFSQGRVEAYPVDERGSPV